MARKTAKTKSKRASKKPAAKAQEPAVLQSGEISFDYIKSTQFRVVRVDGVHGGIAPNGHSIQMALFSERTPIPQRETYRLEKGGLGQLTAREARDAVIREVEVEALMDLGTAKRVVNWLNKKIGTAEQLRDQLGEI